MNIIKFYRRSYVQTGVCDCKTETGSPMKGIGVQGKEISKMTRCDGRQVRCFRENKGYFLEGMKSESKRQSEASAQYEKDIIERMLT